MFLREASEVAVGLPFAGVGPGLEVDVLASVTDRRELAGLASALEVAPGDPSVIYTAPILLSNIGLELGVCYGLNDGVSQPMADLCLRFHAWSGEVLGYVELTTSMTWLISGGHLVNPDLLSRWLTEHGARDYLQARGDRQSSELASDVAGTDWAAAAPTAVRDLTDRMRFTSKTGRMPPDLLAAVNERLSASYPDDVSRAAVLLRWFGAGTGLCNSYPYHEDIPERILLKIPPATVITAVMSDEDDDRLLDGAVRLLAGFHWQRAHPAALESLPDLRLRLLDHALSSDDDDKIRRARHAFS